MGSADGNTREFNGLNVDGDENLHVLFHLGQTFTCRESLKEAILRYAIRTKMNVHYTKSESVKVEAVCATAGCIWKIYASVNNSSDIWTVRSYIPAHTCSWNGHVSLLRGKKIAEYFLDEFRNNPSLKASEMEARLWAQGIKVSKEKCKHARKKCRSIIAAECEEKFRRIHDYIQEIYNSNPGSTVVVKTPDGIFERFYVCFHAQKCGWIQGCRRVIHLDGTFLRGNVKGELLTAVGRDGNNQVYPIAWGIVPVENKNTWEWFLTLLKEDLEFGSGIGMVLVSDKQKGLIAAIETVCPDVEHRMCAIHIWANLKKKYSNCVTLHHTFWKAARAYSMEMFETHMETLKNIRGDAYEDLLRSNPNHWSRAYFADFSKCDAVENNMSESFNAVITNARTMPIVQMLEEIQTLVMKSNNEKMNVINNHSSDLTPWANEVLEEAKQKAMECQTCAVGRGWYQIRHCGIRYRVYIGDCVSCTCRRYEVSGIPCGHIISAMWVNDKVGEPERLVSHWFSTDMWKTTYAEIIIPTNGLDMWPRGNVNSVLPPPDRTMPGRPKEKKKRNGNPLDDPKTKLSRQGKTAVKCRKCHQLGHNRRTCKNVEAPISSNSVAQELTQEQCSSQPLLD